MSLLPVLAVPGATRHFITADSRSMLDGKPVDEMIVWHPVVLSGISWRNDKMACGNRNVFDEWV